MDDDASGRPCDVIGCGEESAVRYLDCRGAEAKTFWVCTTHGGRLGEGAVPVVVPAHPGSGLAHATAALLLD